MALLKKNGQQWEWMPRNRNELGNVSLITLPGDFKTYMTGLGVFYHDSKKTQRVGIVPDVIQLLTIKGIREGRDEVLEKALAVIGNN